MSGVKRVDRPLASQSSPDLRCGCLPAILQLLPYFQRYLFPGNRVPMPNIIICPLGAEGDSPFSGIALPSMRDTTTQQTLSSSLGPFKPRLRLQTSETVPVHLMGPIRADRAVITSGVQRLCFLLPTYRTTVDILVCVAVPVELTIAFRRSPVVALPVLSSKVQLHKYSLLECMPDSCPVETQSSVGRILEALRRSVKNVVRFGFAARAIEHDR